MRSDHQHRTAPKTTPKVGFGQAIAYKVRAVFGRDAYDKASSPKTQMAVALNQKPAYTGSVSKAVVARRRAANKRARQARAMHRRAAR